ncbi:MAG: hypothetical protein ACQERC_10525 [Bacteroidota bacterium]
MNKITLFTVAGLLVAMFACKSEENQKKKVDLPQDQKEQDTSEDEPRNEEVYSIPSPNEQYDLLRALGGELKQGTVNELSNVSEYTTRQEKALNFGVYLSDAAYLMRYDQGKKVFLDYVSTLDKLGRDLDITKVYGKDLMEEVEEIGADSERLFDLTSDNYLTVYDQMIDNGKGSDLTLILGGSWLETMHILFTTSGEFEENYEIQEYIVDQHYVLQNLIGFASTYDDDEDVANLIGQLEEIEGAFEKLDCKESSLEVDQDEGDVMVLSGGSACLFTASSYKNMKSLIKEIRSSIVS